MFRTVSDQVSLWEAVLPPELLKLPDELARVDALLDDPVFFAPFEPFFDPRVGRPSTPMETYLRLMFLKFRYRLGYESLCREVGDSITWRRFCRIPLDGAVPHPTTLMKLTTRCGSAAVDGTQRGAAGQGRRGEAVAHQPGSRGHYGGPGERGLSDGFGVAGQGDASDRGDRAADPGRRRRGAHQGAGPVAGGRQAGARDRGETALPRRIGSRRGQRPRCCKITGELAGPGPDRDRAVTRSDCWATPDGRCAGPRPRPPSCALAVERDAAAGRRRGRLVRAVNDLSNLLEATTPDHRRRPGNAIAGIRPRTAPPGW